jgi:hypothetical protein
MLAITLLAALLLPASPAAPLGPPTLCHPFAIGDAKSLPWGEGSFAARADYDLTQLAGDTYEILSGSDDPLVHGETLRRAALYLSGTFTDRGPTPVELRDKLVAALLDELEFDAKVHEPEACAAREGRACTPGGMKQLWDPAQPWGGRQCQAQARDAALCFLDLGYLRAALREAGVPGKDDGAAALRDALRLQPAKAALQLTAALGLVDHPDAAVRKEAWKLLDAVARSSDDGAAGEHLRTNLLATVGPLLSAKNHDDLVARIHERLAQG